MMIPGGANVSPTTGRTRTYPQSRGLTAATATSSVLKGETPARRFDSVMISEIGGEKAALDLKSKLSYEVRTATSTDMVSSLREQIRNGTYRPDPVEIARKMLLMGESV